MSDWRTGRNENGGQSNKKIQQKIILYRTTVTVVRECISRKIACLK